MVSILSPISASLLRSLPITFIPIGVFIPVASMSIRVFIGIVHAPVNPGILRDFSINSESSLGVICLSVGNIFESGIFIILGHLEKNLSIETLRHCSTGFNIIIVSIMDNGAGSVAVSALPALPNTLLTSGKLLMILSVCSNISCTLAIDIPGRVEGI